MSTAIDSNCAVKTVKKHEIYSFIFLFSLLLCVDSVSANSSAFFNQGQRHNESMVHENLLKVNIFYYKDFPYRQRYANHKIKGCIKRPAEGIVRCKEFISLIRPENKVNNWFHLQHEKGYLPLTPKEFGITNIQGHINKVTPADISSVNNKIDKVSSPYVPATGIFIRHVSDVREYTFKNIKTNVVFSVKVTPEHPVYSVNRQAFVPVSQLLPEDQLLSENGQKIQLICQYGIKKDCSTYFNKGEITAVYNIEVEQRHTYFVQDEKILVHNACKSEVKDIDKSEWPIDLISTEPVDPKKSVALVVMDEEGNILLEVPESQRYTLESLRDYVRIRHPSSVNHDGMYVAPQSRRVIYGIADHKNNVTHFDYINSVSLDSKGELKVENFSSERIEYGFDSFREVGYLKSKYQGQLDRLEEDDDDDGIFMGLFLAGNGAALAGLTVLSGVGLYYVFTHDSPGM